MFDMSNMGQFEDIDEKTKRRFLVVRDYIYQPMDFFEIVFVDLRKFEGFNISYT